MLSIRKILYILSYAILAVIFSADVVLAQFPAPSSRAELVNSASNYAEVLKIDRAKESLLLAPVELGDKIYVEIAFRILNLSEIDEVAQNFKLVGHLVAKWKDPRLAFTPGNPTETIRIYHSDEIWVPHFDFANSEAPHTAVDVTTHVYPDGTVKYYERSSAQLSNNFYLRTFPFDNQTLEFIVQPTVSEEHIVNFITTPNRAFTAEEGAYTGLSQWEIKDLMAEVDHIRGFNNEEVSGVRFMINITRESIFYLWKVFLPLFLMVILSWSVLWIAPRELSSQTQISSTTILTVIAFSFAISNTLPKVPYLTLIDVFFIICYFFVFLTAIEITLRHVLFTKKALLVGKKIQSLSQVFMPTLFVISCIIMLGYYGLL